MGLTIGLVGCGRWGSNHLRTLNALKSTGRIGRVVVCDIDAQKLKAVDADAVYTSLRPMLEQEQLDGLAIVTPPETHVELAREALQRNLPLLVEKPLALEHEDAKAFLTSLSEHNLLVVGYILRHHHGVQRLRSSKIRDVLGNIASVRYERQTVRQRPEGAEPISTLGVHGLDLIAWLLNQSLMAGTIETKSVTTDTALIEMAFQSGQKGAFDVAWNAPEERRLLHVEGGLGRATLDFGSGRLDITSSGTTTTVHSSGRDALHEEWCYFLDHLQAGGKHTLPPVDRLLDQSAWIHTHGVNGSA